MMAILLTALFLLAVTHTRPSAAQDRHSGQRARMVAEIAALARETGVAMGRPSLSEAVLAAMGRVPHHRFVPGPQQVFAYRNRSLPIGEGQTISQPFLVALMTDLLDPKPSDTGLEVGTGSGYQAAVLAVLVAKVYTIEIVEPLGRRAMQLLDELGYRDAEVRIGNGYNGWPEVAPFEYIGVTAAPAEERTAGDGWVIVICRECAMRERRPTTCLRDSTAEDIRARALASLQPRIR
jgi:protein-L-isoaspartate(D-aspartate) O-methyltransferase